MPDNETPERRAWRLLTGCFTWQAGDELPVAVRRTSGVEVESARLQFFEVLMAVIFARLEPDFDWYVTPVQGDGGIDFVGTYHFLTDERLGISAAMKVVGQCKKQETVRDLRMTVAPSMMQIAGRPLNPMLVVFALSAHVTATQIETVQKEVEAAHRHRCEILDRTRIEQLVHDHADVVHDLLSRTLGPEEAADVVTYFQASTAAAPRIDPTPPPGVRAGHVFSVPVAIQSSAAALRGSRLTWRSRRDVITATLVAPMSAMTEEGVTTAGGGDPFRSRHTLDFVSYAVGKVDLGEVVIEYPVSDAETAVEVVPVGTTQVSANLRPRFYEKPVHAARQRLLSHYQDVIAGAVATVAVVGAGGSGKTRLCEEFCLEARSDGDAYVVSAGQAKSPDDPHRLLTDLLVGLSEADLSSSQPAEEVLDVLTRYDRNLAGRVAPAIRTLFGAATRKAGGLDIDSVLSALLLLTVAKSRQGPLILHLQELHWCSADDLKVLDDLVWRLRPAGPAEAPKQGAPRGILLLFEGRFHENVVVGDDTWTSAAFEDFVRKADCPVVTCPPFTNGDSRKFIELLFEAPHHVGAKQQEDPGGLRRSLVERIHRSSGGNPFHSLEQVRVLRDDGVLGQSPTTGLMYLVRPDPQLRRLPDTVFELIRLRWEYLRQQQTDVALLVWATGLIDDRVPMELFRRLWRALAPKAAISDVDATEIVWTDGATLPEATFRHENYYGAVRQFEVSPDDRRRVALVYATWYDSFARLEPIDQYRRARVALEFPERDVRLATRLFRSALQGARRQDDLPLARRIALALLDLAWSEEAASPGTARQFLRLCDEEIDLVRELLASDRRRARERLEHLLSRIESRAPAPREPAAHAALRRRRLTADVLHARALYIDGSPSAAAAAAADVVREIRDQRTVQPAEELIAWRALEAEALYAQGVGLAIGNRGGAPEVMAEAVAIAKETGSPLTLRIVSTYANLLLARDPAVSERMLEDALATTGSAGQPLRANATVTLSMALVVQAHRLPGDASRRRLAHAEHLLHDVYYESDRLRNYPDAAAAALMRGIVAVLRESDDAVHRFSEACIAALRGNHRETLWKAQLDLATALHATAGEVTGAVREHARIALELLNELLDPFPDPDRAPRFARLLPALAFATRFLLLAGDDAARSALQRYPELRACFRDTATGELRDDIIDKGWHHWVSGGKFWYVIY